MVTQDDAVKLYLNTRAESELINKRIDDLRDEMKDGFERIENLLSAHLDRCDKRMKEHDDEIKSNNEFKYKVFAWSGAIAFFSALGFKLIFHI